MAYFISICSLNISIRCLLYYVNMLLRNVRPVSWVHRQFLQICRVSVTNYSASSERLSIGPSRYWYFEFIINFTKRFIYIAIKVLESFGEFMRVAFYKYPFLHRGIFYYIIRRKYYVWWVHIIRSSYSVALLWQPWARIASVTFFISILTQSFQWRLLILYWLTCQ